MTQPKAEAICGLGSNAPSSREVAAALSASFEFDPVRSLVYVTYRGRLTVGEVAQVIEKLSGDPRFQPGVGIVSDHSRGETFGTADLVAQIMPRFAELAERNGPLRVALITPREVQIGMANLAAVHASPHHIQIQPFQTREAAEAWLIEAR